jgi:hypothetical protein
MNGTEAQLGQGEGLESGARTEVDDEPTSGLLEKRLKDPCCSATFSPQDLPNIQD